VGSTQGMRLVLGLKKRVLLTSMRRNHTIYEREYCTSTPSQPNRPMVVQSDHVVLVWGSRTGTTICASTQVGRKFPPVLVSSTAFDAGNHCLLLRQVVGEHLIHFKSYVQ
jgi:hypothetical protein